MVYSKQPIPHLVYIPKYHAFSHYPLLFQFPGHYQNLPVLLSESDPLKWRFYLKENVLHVFSMLIWSFSLVNSSKSKCILFQKRRKQKIVLFSSIIQLLQKLNYYKCSVANTLAQPSFDYNCTIWYPLVNKTFKKRKMFQTNSSDFV